MSGVYAANNYLATIKVAQNRSVKSDDQQCKANVSLSANKESLKAIIVLWIQRHQQRKALAKLDQRLLDDVGLTPEAVAKEIAKPFWK